MRGDYEVAVFQAFKEVEMAVRATAKLPAEVVGVSLMRRAFYPENGPLANFKTIPSEREALIYLFAGAMGHPKNPHGTSRSAAGIWRGSATHYLRKLSAGCGLYA